MDHLGRLIDHVHLRVADVEASFRFYSAILQALGRSLTRDGSDFWSDELYVSPADDYISRIHLAFQASGEEDVRRFHAAGLGAGGRDNGAPGPRDYHPGYFGAFLIDPDGNNIEAVWHGETRRSADSISVERIGQPQPEPQG